ncbi:unnamed protein product [Zymoseptoria tritici ST99CH_1A5]|uniref:Uncharacterized protein n=1 Tax=Zymoseptoria tritici ST99CH_1A5 TaxID=1276529 RepID=A0A1Y6L9Z3_ZYMTR|nr:unnamed protein product [Zymoseptoria tritici ST99CH_1A5]
MSDKQQTAAVLSPTTPPPGLSYMDFYTAKAQAKFKAHPELIETVQLRQPTQSDLARQQHSDNRLDQVIETSNILTQEALAQLAEPCTTTPEPTLHEIVEMTKAGRWMTGYRAAEQVNRDWLDRNQDDFEQVMASIDDLDALGVDLAGLDVATTPTMACGPTIPTDQVAQDWFAGTSNFREATDEEFETGRPTELGLLRTLAVSQIERPASSNSTVIRRDSLMKPSQPRSSSVPSLRSASSKSSRKRQTFPAPKKTNLLSFQATFSW